MNTAAKVALVTGASRGIGAAILHALAAAGMTVVGTATTEAGAEAISAGLQQAGYQGCGLMLNVTDEESIKQCFAAINQAYGAPTILVNNAAITRDNLFLRMKDEQWFDVINTNLNAIYRVTKYCLKGMLKQRWGRIITISSVVGLMGNPGQANYAAAKAGIRGFSKSLALEVANRNITVNVVAPGLVETDMAKALNDEQREQILKNVPLSRLAMPDEIAAGVTFLASDGAAYITGETLNINGGIHMV